MKGASSRFWKMLTAVGGMTLVGGCTQFYNGAVGLSTRDRQAAEHYQAYRQDREERLYQARGGSTTRRPAGAARSSRPMEPGNTGSAPATSLKQMNTPGAEEDVRARGLRGREAAGLQGNRAVADLQGGREAADFQNPSDAQRSVPRIHGRSGLGVYGQLPASREAGSSDGLPPSAATSPLDGPGNLQRMTFTSEGADFDVTLDPSGRTMVYASTRHRETADLYAQRIDGTAVAQLTDDPGNDLMPAVSPDGKWIAFASDRSGSWDLYLISIHGGPAVQLTQDRSQNVHPTWSSDGRYIAYSAYGSGSGQWEIVLIEAANPSVKRYLTHGLFPTWHPSENRLLFQRARQRGTRWFSLWTVDLVEGEATRPTEIVASSNAAIITPAWSRDGRHIAFCTVTDPEAEEDQPTVSDLWLMRADGTGRTRLTGGPFAHLQPTWSPDGQIYFVSDRFRSGVENIWMLDPARALAAVQGAGERAALSRAPAVPSPAGDRQLALPPVAGPATALTEAGRPGAAPAEADAAGRSPLSVPQSDAIPAARGTEEQADPFVPAAVRRAAVAGERL